MRILKTLSTVLLVCGFSSPVVLGQVLHVIAVGDTDSNIGQTIWPDLYGLNRTLKDGLTSRHLHWIPLTGRNATPNNVVHTLKTVVIDPSRDAVMLYYSGHGGYDRQRGHFLHLSHGGQLFRSEVQKAITNPVTPRFWAIVTDCCANITDVPMTAAAGDPPTRRKRLLHHLFFETTGSINITSSRPEQVSSGNESMGGVFTYSLCEVLNRYKYDVMRWDEVFFKVREQTSHVSEIQRFRSSDLHVHYGIRQRVQTPYSFQKMYNREVNGLRCGMWYENQIITKVSSGSPADRAGLRRGMRVDRINGVDMQSDSQITTAINFSPQTANIIAGTGGSQSHFSIELAY